MVVTSGGYPGAYKTGVPISGVPAVSLNDRTIVFHAGTTYRNGRLVTAGGRVLGVTGRAATLMDARDAAYHTVRLISFDGCHYRTDIAARAMLSPAS